MHTANIFDEPDIVIEESRHTRTCNILACNTIALSNTILSRKIKSLDFRTRIWHSYCLTLSMRIFKLPQNGRYTFNTCILYVEDPNIYIYEDQNTRTKTTIFNIECIPGIGIFISKKHTKIVTQLQEEAQVGERPLSGEFASRGNRWSIVQPILFSWAWARSVSPRSHSVQSRERTPTARNKKRRAALSRFPAWSDRFEHIVWSLCGTVEPETAVSKTL